MFNKEEASLTINQLVDKPFNATKPKNNPMMRNIKNSGIREALFDKSRLNWKKTL